MAHPEWEKLATDEPIYEGVREAEQVDLSEFDVETGTKIRTILDAMDVQELIVFGYGESDRVVAPFVVGVSSSKNPLLRAYQMEGISRSGKGPGWRVFQVNKMENVREFWEYFNVDDFSFDFDYPWIYKVIKTLEGGTP
jgi:hypothetical protein